MIFAGTQCVQISIQNVTDCGTIPYGVNYIDHTATAITIKINSIALKTRKCNNSSHGKLADWLKIAYDVETTQQFNIKLSNELLQHTNTTNNCTSFFELVRVTAKLTALKPEQQTNAWLDKSRGKLLPGIN